MIEVLQTVNGIVWGAPALILILGVGFFLSIRTGFAQITLFPKAMRSFLDKFRRKDVNSDGVSPMQALCTALAATVGTGNLAGVAGAMAIGGPGAIFWMWLCALLGMATKFAEATLAVRYRVKCGGEYVGGPMYMILEGVGPKWKWLASLYAFFGVVAAFGVGNATQINAVITGIDEALCFFGGTPTALGDLMMGVILAAMIAGMLLGGAARIGRVAERLVPFAAAGYLLLGCMVLIARFQAVPGAFAAIFEGAFSPRAVTGGVVGSLLTTLRIGVSRGVFTNEAGMGTASIAHAGAQVQHPVQQGLMGIMEVFLDTIVICTMTALVILVSGVPIPYGTDPGVALTTAAFEAVCGGWVSVAIAGALCCFAFATVLGWGLYGARCAQFLFGGQVWRKFALLQAVTVVLSAVLNTETVWLLSEIINGLMAIPNLIALAVLSKELHRLTIEYKNGVTYENFNQRKPLRALSHAEVPSFGSKGQKGGKEDLSFEHRSA
jgi:AGCS family alanine or glycine:cation symporter